MKVKFIKKHQIGSNKYNKGDQANMINSLAGDLIKKKICIATEFVTLQEKEVEKISEVKGKEIIEDLPEDAEEIKKK